VNTDRLIERLARDVEPVRRLRRPWVRAALWSLAASLYAIVLAVPLTSSHDFAVNTANPGFVAQQTAAIVMAFCAAVAAFASVIPGYSHSVLALPAVGVSTWLATLMSRVPQEWHAARLAGLADTHEWLCVPTIALTAVPPALALALMLRHGAPLSPRFSAALCLLAAAGLTNVVTCLASPHQSAIAVLVWHGTTLLALCALAAGIGRSVLPWRVPIPSRGVRGSSAR
jgi:hypothetical protein